MFSGDGAGNDADKQDVFSRSLQSSDCVMPSDSPRCGAVAAVHPGFQSDPLELLEAVGLLVAVHKKPSLMLRFFLVLP